MVQIYKRNNKWSVRVVFKDSKGTRKTKNKSGFETKKEAEIYANELENERNKGSNLSKKNISFYDYYKNWIEIYKLPNVVKSSQNRFSNYLKIIDEYFGNIKLVDITRADYQKFMNEYSKTRTKTTCIKINSVYRAVVKEAINDQIIYSDFTYKVTINSKKESSKKSKKIISSSQYNKLVQECEMNLELETMSYYIILTAALTGLRYQEVTGLTWECVDFEKEELHIQNTFDYKDTMRIIPQVKTINSQRTYPMMNELTQLLKDLKHKQSKLFLQQGYRDEENACFRNMYHSISSNTAVNKVLRLIETKIGIPVEKQITIHGLRHTFASYLLYKGNKLPYISKMLGHANTSITRYIYPLT